MRKTLLLLIPVALLGACSWGIKLDDAGKAVHTAWNGDVATCHDLGKITVSVMDRVGPVDRNNITVRDELEVMARNEAATMHADTIKPLGEPVDGSQAWGAYQCGNKLKTPGGSAPATAASAAPTQTFPIHNG
ncbi:MAG: DUF4156 domain-containing protein [Rhodanobacter sp.]|jgi:hypothetical protein|nr:DUF4156 domain-containing protein [Rhodanobacter sp.]